MRIFTLLLAIVLTSIQCIAQTNPAILKWLQNSTVNGSYYTVGNYTPITNSILANCQLVQYSTTNVYVTTKGIPVYPTGPFLDGNPSQATNQNAIFKFPLAPVQNNGTPTATTGGNIGIFINGVALFDYRDGVSWSNAAQQEQGGPIGGSGDGVWNRDAVVAERIGFDCAKGHPAMGNYHHHQNPSAFDNDLNIISTICNLYDSDGLYTINPSAHSPLLGFAYDGFPIYGAYGYANTNGTGGITRIKSGYQLRNITVRTTYANGSSVTPGPPVSATYPLGRYREDYEWIAHSGQADYLDDHNGRFCVTPEYPSGIYAYFCTVDVNHNSAYPYAVGPTFYGTKVAAKVTSVPAGTTTYTAPLPVELLDFNAYLHPQEVELLWQTASERNTKAFEVERSENGCTFSSIGTVRAQGNSSTKTDYSFIDYSPIPKTSYYRLRQVDFDDHEDYSKIVSVTTKEADAYKAYFSQNSSLIVIQNKGLTKEKAAIELYDACGRFVQSTQIYAGGSIAFIDTQSMYDGVYFLIVKEAGKNTSFTIHVQHE